MMMITKASKVAKVLMEPSVKAEAIMAKANLNLPLPCGVEPETRPLMDQTNSSLEATMIGTILVDLPPVLAVDLGEITATTLWAVAPVAMEV